MLLPREVISLASQKKSQAKQPDPKNQGKYTPKKPDDVEYLTVPEFARMYRLNPDSVRRQCQNGEIPEAVKFGRLWRIPVKEELCS